MMTFTDDSALVDADLGIKLLKSKVELAIRRIDQCMNGRRLKPAFKRQKRPSFKGATKE